MAQIVANAEMIQQLTEANGPIQVVDDQGRMIGYCMSVKSAAPSDYSPEYIEERRKALASVREQVRTNPKSGKPLKEILANLNRLAGEGS